MNKKISNLLLASMVGFTVGCDDSSTTSGTGYAYADKTGGGNTYGNLYKSYVSKSGAYAEIKFEGTVGENSSGDQNWIVLPIWYRDGVHHYACVMTEGDQGGLDPEIFVLADATDGTNNETFIGTVESGKSITDVFSSTDSSEKTFGCELREEGGSLKVSAYLNGVRYMTYVVGSSVNPVGSSGVLDPGIGNSSYNGRAGFGIVSNWGDPIKVKQFVLYDKRPQ